jgi:hypothetical protein
MSPALAAVLALLVTACGATTGLLPAIYENTVDTIALYALDGTPVSRPSGYIIATKAVVRTDQRGDFDFAFNLTPAGAAVLAPTGALGLGIGSGILPQSVPFDAVTIAPTTRYVDSLPVTVDSGTVAVVHSRAFPCQIGSAFYYGKLEVLAIDTAARRIDLRILVDLNCGYRGLEPGLPQR